MNFRRGAIAIWFSLASAAWLILADDGLGQTQVADALSSEESTMLLNLPGSGADPAAIDYASLPVLRGAHTVISPEDTETWKFQLHNYLLFHDGRYWCMWSHGPREDDPPQHVRYATSSDGLHWSPSREVVGPAEGNYGYIARGFWPRDGELLALVARYKGRGAFGVDKELQLQAFVWDQSANAWKFKGSVYDDAINNFPPQMLPTGQWIMERRNARFKASMLIGGIKALDDWQSYPVTAARREDKFTPDEPFSWLAPDQRMVALFRDNGGSSRLFRAESKDLGKTWSNAVKTNFPNATSKFFVLRTSQGQLLMISNAHPQIGRRELYLSISDDGMVFHRMARLEIPSSRPSTLQYPHALERNGELLIAFSRNKATIELLKISLADVAVVSGAASK